MFTQLELFYKLKEIRNIKNFKDLLGHLIIFDTLFFYLVAYINYKIGGLNLRVKGKKRNNIKETKLRNEVTKIINE